MARAPREDGDDASVVRGLPNFFASAIFSGVVFISATGILLSPVFHRDLHRFHIEEKES